MFQEISISVTGCKTGEVIRSELLEIFFAKVVLKESTRGREREWYSTCN
jgi:hypothetical protein